MANRVAWLTKRVKIGGQWLVRKLIIKTSDFVTEKVVYDGHSVHAPGTFVLEWKLISTGAIKTVTLKFPRKTIMSAMTRNGIVFVPSLNLLGVDFLAVPAVIGVARDMTLSVSDKRGTSQVALDEEGFRTQRQVFVLVLSELGP
jgi:hypothetical protein